MLSAKAKSILNSPDLVAERDAWFARLASHFDRTVRNRPFRLLGHVAGWDNTTLKYTAPELWMEHSLETLADMIANHTPSENDAGKFRPWCVEGWLYGVHFIDRIFGCNVYFTDGNWFNDYLPRPVGTLETPDLDNNETWILAKRAALAFVESGVKLPLLGTDVLSSTLNIAVNLFSEEILSAMLDNPDAARHDFLVINETLKAMRRWFVDNVPASQLQPSVSGYRTQPPGYGQLCGCTTYLLSAEQYAEFIAPLDNDLLGLHPHGGMIHLCGSHARHIPTFRDMPNVKSVQLNDRAAHDLRTHYEILRDDQLIYFEPCENMHLDLALSLTNNGDRLVIVG